MKTISFGRGSRPKPTSDSGSTDGLAGLLERLAQTIAAVVGSLKSIRVDIKTGRTEEALASLDEAIGKVESVYNAVSKTAERYTAPSDPAVIDEPEL